MAHLHQLWSLDHAMLLEELERLIREDRTGLHELAESVRRAHRADGAPVVSFADDPPCDTFRHHNREGGEP